MRPEGVTEDELRAATEANHRPKRRFDRNLRGAAASIAASPSFTSALVEGRVSSLRAKTQPVRNKLRAGVFGKPLGDLKTSSTWGNKSRVPRQRGTPACFCAPIPSARVIAPASNQ